MAYRSKKVSIPVPVFIVVIVLVIALFIGMFVMTNGKKNEGNGTSSEVISSQVESVVSVDDTKGDIIFREGEGYDLLSVVNKNYKMSLSDGLPELVILSDEVTMREGGDYKVDARVEEPLANFLDAARMAGYNPILWSAFRTQEYQSKLYENAITKYIDSHPGASRDEAVANVTETAPPGTSEHCTGLAVDIYTWTDHSKFGSLDQQFGDTAFGQWLEANAHLYGFILRYPEDKEDITMISYEPWHFRYVGVEAATEIYEQGISLEEYTGKLGE